MVDSLTNLFLKEALLLGGQPMKCRNLVASESHEGIAGAEGMIEERERMILG